MIPRKGGDVMVVRIKPRHTTYLSTVNVNNYRGSISLFDSIETR
jgi:hypothetical protein